MCHKHASYNTINRSDVYYLIQNCKKNKGYNLTRHITSVRGLAQFSLVFKHVSLMLSDTDKMLVLQALMCWCGGTEGKEDKGFRTMSFLF